MSQIDRQRDGQTLFFRNPMWNASGVVHQTGHITCSDSVRATSRLKLPIEEGEKRAAASVDCISRCPCTSCVCYLVYGDAA